MKKIFFVLLIVVLLSSVMTLPVCAAVAPNSSAPADDLSVLDQLLLEFENNNIPAAVELILTVLLLPLLIVVGLLGIVAFLVFLAIKYIGIWLFFI